ncbi:hypothetical protein AYL99_11758 [Fonsecaea erecta]|uniref:Uncharacterized protein n=1 Tax=Fonsecaea erecta TaxID=1367422 RepID=A0A178Z2G5_9EURO|nr:hypothetical protein AYL99_11758 [Fonsecaea erecta]OAP53998.1 hypothetical protein AYL99_11758 [Fonsecaea erecta]
MPPPDALDESYPAKMSAVRGDSDESVRKQPIAGAEKHGQAVGAQHGPAAAEEHGGSDVAINEKERTLPAGDTPHEEATATITLVRTRRALWWLKLLIAVVWCVYGSWLIGLAFRLLGGSGVEDRARSRQVQFAKCVVEILCWVALVQDRMLLKWRRHVFQAEPGQEDWD